MVSNQFFILINTQDMLSRISRIVSFIIITQIGKMTSPDFVCCCVLIIFKNIMFKMLFFVFFGNFRFLIQEPIPQTAGENKWMPKIMNIERLNNKLLSSLNDTNYPLGLADGKMGICIYFYVLSRQRQNAGYKAIAGKILDDIFQGIKEVASIDVKSGLSGVGLGIDYLIRNNYIKGDINTILKDIDHVVYRELSFNKYSDKIDALALTQILYYLCVRLRNQKNNTENEYLFKELIIHTLNNIYGKIDADSLKEPLSYTLDYLLPQFLFVLSEIYWFNFYTLRLGKIIDELSYSLLSIIPKTHSFRLYLLWGMKALQQCINNKDWEKHMVLLRNELDVSAIMDEMKHRNVFFHNGIASIYLLLKSLRDYYPSGTLNDYLDEMYQQMELSEI